MSEQRQRRRRRPAHTVEQRENQLISLAYDLAEKQLMDGTAAAQVTTQFLKMGSTRERLEQERLKQDNLLLAAKIEAMARNERMEEMYAEALNAMRSYSGNEIEVYDDDNEAVY